MPPPPPPPRKPDHLTSQPQPPPIPGNKPKPRATPSTTTSSGPTPTKGVPSLPPRHRQPIKKRCLAWDWTSTRDNIPMQPFLSPHPETHAPSLISSVHNWNAWSPPESQNLIPFRPMARTAASLANEDWAMLADNPHKILHFLNEPERLNPPVSPAQAADLWMEQFVPLRRKQGKELVSPCAANDPAGTAWLIEFMGIVAARGELPDYLGLHYYSVSAEGAMAYLAEMHERWPQLPVVVTEIACISRDEWEVMDFTRRLGNWMDERAWVYEYAFFGCMRGCADGFVSPAAQLMSLEGGLTRLMEMVVWEQPMRGW